MISWIQDIHAHSNLVSYQHIPKIHSEPINRILYEPHDELIITSSESPASSVVIIDVSQKRQEYIWKIEKVIMQYIMQQWCILFSVCYIVSQVNGIL